MNVISTGVDCISFIFNIEVYLINEMSTDVDLCVSYFTYVR